MKTTKLIKEFIVSEKAGGLILIICTVGSLLIANSSIGNSYLQFWHIKLVGNSIEYWINEGLMTIFFLLIGLELKRELYIGELSSIKEAILPVIAALGGMIIPASIYFLFNHGTLNSTGIGIPMATDIAFALGVLSLLGKRVPLSLKIFLTALAVIDDLGAVLVIAIFYTKTLIWLNLLIALSIFVILIICNKLKIKNLIPYLIGGIAMWYFMLYSGVHATISGVLLAFTIPLGNRNPQSSSYLLQHFIHKPVAFIILPIFALANTAILLNFNLAAIITQHYSLGIALGLIIGKPLGIILFTLLAIKSGICKLPAGLNMQLIAGAGIIAGIGFTMSIFITLLAFSNETIINNAKFIILLSSLVSGLVGLIILNTLITKKQ